MVSAIRDHAALDFEGLGVVAVASAGYRSGRNVCRTTPVTRSTSITRSAGMRFHCETAWDDMLSASASFVTPPAAEIAISTGFSITGR